MEDVLERYARPLDPLEPVVCLDEKPVQLLEDARPVKRAAGPGEITKRDYEYIRRGTANIFAALEPKAGRHFSRVTPNRSAVEFAKMVGSIERRYPQARTIHLVVDNLNTHVEKSLVGFYGPEEGHRIWGRFTAHYTPKHGSWLNQAEIENSLLGRQALGSERVPKYRALQRRVRGWTARANRRQLVIHWRFTTEKARRVFGYRPKFTRSQD